MPAVYNERTGMFEEKHYASPPKLTIVQPSNTFSLLKGGTYTIMWDIEDAEHLLIDGQNTPLDSSGKTFTANEAGIITHRLIAKNDCGNIEKTVSINVLAMPHISFTASTQKLREGHNENSIIRWSVENCQTITFADDNESFTVSPRGERKVKPTSTTKYKIIVTALDGNTRCTRELTIHVLPVSSTHFSSSRNYTLPGVPIVLSWTAKNSISIKLEGYGEQDEHGKLVVYPSTETTYKLKVKDHFDTKDYNITIRMLPVPHIKALMVPTPNLQQDLNLQITQPHLEVNLHLPEIKVMGINLSMPRIKSLTDLNTNTELNPPKEKSFGIFEKIKNLYNIYFSQHEQ